MKNFDLYTFRARVLPAFIVIFPLAVIPVVVYPDASLVWKTVIGLCTAFGLTALLAQVGRDKGKLKEADLFKSWGGIPTTLMLSHLHTKLSPVSLKRYHARLGILVTGIKIPTLQEERLNTSQAHDVYQSCAQCLRELTRDSKKFNLLFNENVNYGFRRNLWAMKPAGILTSSLGMFLCAAVFCYYLVFHQSLEILPLIVAVLNCFLLTLWLLRINPDWIKLVADSYAERLITTLETL